MASGIPVPLPPLQKMDCATPVSILVFGYGSIIWKQEFEYTRSFPCCVAGYRRVFFQGSTDHRGTPGKPGRVVTLIQSSEPNSFVAGVAFELPPDAAKREEILAKLDHRESGGYVREEVKLYDISTHEALNIAEGTLCLCYRATEENSEYLGEATEEVIAQQVADCAGPSGPNSEYVFKLAEGLRALGVEDAHVFTVEREVRRILGQGAAR
ncbi:putative ChaC like protein [Trypanosoma vivax]|uniref:glutathione-specific gamma-glutamylcyclotransferase n=1 Tax=Trypanosoma vivax (strain Y486) TaxID=1055687 RepID=F9WNA7_TRYVY|nr:ChaC-like protein [Trypanosoma vivax]KAH8619713.1 putative ChaC like protein [Trypanosoma vivax]CCD19023.1 ChaC-like protein [Trypanosoma vivax Y486]|eukprot:CCD19023.1 ChaC-like protein [Trypanosoma vivax Y486]